MRSVSPGAQRLPESARRRALCRARALYRITTMAPQARPIPKPPTTHALCFGGDWACAHGDFEALEYVAHQLAARVPEPLHSTLIGVACACRSDPAQAVPLWMEAKQEVLSQTRDSQPARRLEA